MTDRPPLCDGAATVTAGWMNLALIAGGVFDSPAIADVSVENLGAASNAAGTLLRCHLVGSDGSAPAPESVIVKLPASSRVPVRVTKWLSLHKREYRYYRNIAPHTELRSPALLYGDFDERTHRYVLVLEDLGHLECPSQTTGVDAGRAMSAVRAIARLHGRFWGKTDRAPTSGSYAVHGTTAGRVLHSAYALALPRALDLFDDHFTARTRRLAESLAPLVARHMAATDAGPRTFIHGDYRSENMFFGPGGSGEFAAIDWQASGIGSGLYDLAYFMGGSVPDEDRRRIEAAALGEYHDIVRGLGVTDLTLADCRRSYRRHMLDTLVVHVLGCRFLRLSDEDTRELMSGVMQRVLVAVEDLDAGEFLPDRGRSVRIGAILSTLPLRAHRLVRLARRPGGPSARRAPRGPQGHGGNDGEADEGRADGEHDADRAPQ